MARRSSFYSEYIQSDEWKEVRREALDLAGWQCNRCSERIGLQVHHITYKNLGCEEPGDLEVLCEHHHEIADHERVAARAKRRFHRRVAGWAEKVYGPGWERHVSFRQVACEFEQWLDSKNYDL